MIKGIVSRAKTITDSLKGPVHNQVMGLLTLVISVTAVTTAALLAPPVTANELDLQQMAAPLYHTEKQIIFHKLDNGLQLRLLPLADNQLVSLASQFRVGSRDETSGQTGYAHLFEHMLFKGSENAPGDSYAQTMSAISGQFNASTFFDFTNYYLTIPSEALKLSLWLEADRFIRPALTEQTVKNQQDTVLEEMATSIDNQPYIRKAMEFLLTQARDTPYGHAVIGSREDVKNATKETLEQFHHTHYRPDAMQLSIVGALPENTALWVEEEFGRWQNPEQALKAPLKMQFDNQAVHGEVVDERGPWPALLLAWHTVGQTHPDAAAVSLLEAYLFQNRSSLIKQSGLTEPDQLLTYSIPLSMEQMGVSNLVMVPRAKTSLDRLAGNVERAIETLATNGISDQALSQLKANWLNKRLQLIDRPSQLARALSATLAQDSLTPLTGPWERINAVSPAQLQAVAQTYFSQGYVRLDLLPPWYIRWTKTLLEWFPQGLSDTLEDLVL